LGRLGRILSKVAVSLMMVYDEDAVSEEVILAWFYKFSRSSWNMI
jgi:hypothetical protein